MTKDDVKQAFKKDGKAIALAMSQYFKEQIAERKIKPLEYYKSRDFQKEIKSDKNDIVAVAQEIFSV